MILKTLMVLRLDKHSKMNIYFYQQEEKVKLFISYRNLLEVEEAAREYHEQMGSH